MSIMLLLIKSIGEMAERFKVPPWKGGVLERVPGVRISLSPQVLNVVKNCERRGSAELHFRGVFEKLFYVLRIHRIR
jgi:hypothetical protein